MLVKSTTLVPMASGRQPHPSAAIRSRARSFSYLSTPPRQHIGCGWSRGPAGGCLLPATAFGLSSAKCQRKSADMGQPRQHAPSRSPWRARERVLYWVRYGTCEEPSLRIEVVKQWYADAQIFLKHQTKKLIVPRSPGSVSHVIKLETRRIQAHIL
jgi:hypothetical protein